MSEVKITDLVSREAIVEIKELNTEIRNLLDTYTNTAKELAKGLNIEVRGIGDIDKLEKLLVEKTREASETNERLNAVLTRRSQVMETTTNTISRQLMEQERVNKSQREAYTDTESFKKLLEQVNGSYENRVKRLVETNQAIAANKKQQDDLKKSLEAGRISQEQYNKRLVELTMAERELKQSKADLTTHLKNEEREMQSVEGSYKNLSQRLELMKKAYKDLTEEERNSPLGKEMETAIQNLDAHLKDVAADMGEFQRNVGNYAIAGQNGVVATESLMAAIEQQAVTMKDVADQTKILTEAKGMLDTSDENYGNTIDAINAKLAENRARLTDVSDIMNTQATTVAEAETQNQRLNEALRNVDLSSEEAQSTIAALNAKIEENNKVIEAGSGNKASIKKDLKELVLEIANLSIEYQNLSEEEKASAEGQELANHINDLIERAGILKDAIADTNAAIANAASDTRGFDQLCGTIQLAIDGFGLAEGASHLLGISTEELTEIQTKFQAAIAASNAMQSIQNTLQSQSAVMQGVNLVQTKLRTIAENLHTAAQGKGVVATTALTAAQWAFNAAASANPIGLLVVGIVAATAAVWGLVKAFQAFFGPSDEALQKYREQKKALEDLCEANDKLIDRMKARGAAEAELLKQSLLNKQAEKEAAEALFARASQLYDDDEDEYKDALEAKKKADEDYRKSVESGIMFLEKIQSEVYAREREDAIGTLAYKLEVIEKEKQEQLKLAGILFRNGEITREIYENIVAAVNKAAEIKVKDVTETENKKNSPSKHTSGGSSRVNDAKKQAEDLKKAVQDGEDALLKIISDSLERQRQAELLSYERQLKALRERLAKTKENEVSLREALNRQIEGLTAEHDRKMEDLQVSRMERYNKAEAEFISSHLAIVKSGTEEELQWRHKELSNQYQAELLAIQKNEMSKVLTAEQAEEMRANLTIKYADLREKAEEDHAEKMVELIAKRYADEQNLRDNAMLSELNDQKRLYAEKMKEAKGNTAKMEKNEEDFQLRCLEIQEKYAEESAMAAVEMLEKALNEENLSAEDREKIEQELIKAKMEMETLGADHAIAQMKRTETQEQNTMEKRKAAISQWLNVASDALNAINDLSGAIFDAKIQRIEEEQNANQEASDKEQTRISELVEKKVITEEEGEARKRAAEALTAKKNEELEKKKAQLQHKQAVYQKANDLAQAGIATALAITQALPNLILAGIAGAMGFAQIATIIATPIPKYAKGTDYHKGGPAIVGDGGRPELVVFGGNSWITPDTPTLVDMPEGAMVVPNLDKIGNDLFSMPSIPEQVEKPKQVIVSNFQRLEAKMDTFISLLRRHTATLHQDSLAARYENFKNSRI